MLVEDNFTCGCRDNSGNGDVADFLCNANLDCCVNCDNAVLISHNRFGSVAEHLALALFACLVDCEVVRAENHILRRNGNGLSV